MRRRDRERGREFALAVIDRCAWGTAAFQGEEPYCLPLSLVRVGEYLYFHCALEGKKLELLRRDGRMCVTFVGHCRAAENEFTTYFQCAMVTGTAVEVTDREEKLTALNALCRKLTPANMDSFDAEAARSLSRTGVWKLPMEEVTAKEKPDPEGLKRP